jgi:hypothetical protein
MGGHKLTKYVYYHIILNMKSRVTTFEAELSTNAGLSGHLALRALDAFEIGDNDAFKYASEIHDETQTRIQEIETARASVIKSIEVARHYHGEETFRRAVGSTALAAVVLNRELRIA